MKLNQEELKTLVEKAKAAEDKDLAIVLHVFRGARLMEIDGIFASVCADWALKRMDELEKIKEAKNRKNN